jgi:prefoldin subunit 5
MEEINQQATRLQSQEAVLKQNNQKLMQTRDDLQQKIEELNLFKAEEDKRLQERDAKSQIWVSKLKDKFKKQEEDLKEKLKEKEDYIKELENKFVKLN